MTSSYTPPLISPHGDRAADLLDDLADHFRPGNTLPLYLAVACVDLQPFWATCHDAAPMLRILARSDLRAAVRAACACARTSLHLASAYDGLPLLSIETAEAWVDRRISDGRARLVAGSAETMKESAYTDYSGNAVYHAVIAASATISAVFVSYYAVLAAVEAANAVGKADATDRFEVARDDHLAALADVVRMEVPTAPKINPNTPAISF